MFDNIFALNTCISDSSFRFALILKVCGVDKVTYGNACQAGASNVQVAYEGECIVFACPKNIDQVCSNGKTYDNSCLAVADFIAYKGECTDSVPEVVPFETNSESTTSPSPTVKPTVPEVTPTVDSPDPNDKTDAPVESDPVGVLSEPSSAPAAVIGTTTVLAVSAFIFVAI